MNEENNNNTNLDTNNNANADNAQHSANQNGNSSTDSSGSNSNSMDNNRSLEDSIIEQKAYKELFEEQKKEIEALKREISQVKLTNQKLAIQQNTGSPRLSAEELINKMFN